MSIFNKLFSNIDSSSMKEQKKTTTICSPFNGTTMKISEIPDPVFNQGILGPGCGISPTEETVHAPFDGKVVQIADTKHAIGLSSTDGIEVLIHVGMDTVAMNGRGFTCLVQEGQIVKVGQPLLVFSLADIQSAGHPATTAIVVTNADEFVGVEVVTTGQVQRGVPILQVNKSN